MNLAYEMASSTCRVKANDRRALRQRPTKSSSTSTSNGTGQRKRPNLNSNTNSKIKIQKTKIVYNPNWAEELGTTDTQLALLPHPSKCLFCGSSEDNPDIFGSFIHHTYTGLKVHNFCMLLASGLSQKYEDDGDLMDSEVEYAIYGFLIFDIFKELQRSSVLRCNYCRKMGATIGCAVKKCRIKFHYPCARERNALSQFFATFGTYCIIHRPLQSFLPIIQAYKSKFRKVPNAKMAMSLSHFKYVPYSECCICMDSVECKVDGINCLTTVCCFDTWFHRTCIQQYALSSGLYYFKCPKCKNDKEFLEEMHRMGIYVPDRDASWEQSRDAFVDLLERHSTCDAKHCKCPFGKNHHVKGTEWSVVLCDLCGSSGIHVACDATIEDDQSAFACETCVEINGWEEVRKLSIRLGIISKDSEVYLDKIKEEKQAKKLSNKPKNKKEKCKKIRSPVSEVIVIYDSSDSESDVFNQPRSSQHIS